MRVAYTCVVVREGIYLFDHGIDPYSGGSFRHVSENTNLGFHSSRSRCTQSPLLLSFFSTALPLTHYTSPVLWAAADILAAWALERIWRLRTGLQRTKRDAQVVALYVQPLLPLRTVHSAIHRYLFNPYILLPSLAFSTSSIENALTLLSLMLASRGERRQHCLSLALNLDVASQAERRRRSSAWPSSSTSPYHLCCSWLPSYS